MMGESIQTEQERARYDVDNDLLWILIVSGVTLALSIFLNPAAFVTNPAQPLVLRTLVMLLLQFGLMGLGVLMVMIRRRETLPQYGFRRAGLAKGLLLSLVAALPLLGYYLIRGISGYLPMSNILTVQEWTGQGFLWGLCGVLPAMLIWGGVQALSYVVIAEKIDLSDPVENPWLSMGPISCALIYLVLNGYSFSLAGLPNLLCTLVTVWALLQARRVSGNAWGTLLVFCFLFNALLF